MVNLKKEKYLLILLISCFVVLTSALAIQYIFGYQPCNLCVIERIPYVLAIIILILNYNFENDQVFYSVLLLLVFLFSFIISLYHLGIEQGLIDESSICESNNKNLITKEEILNSFQEIRISCKDVTFRIFNLSLTTYNMIISIIMFLISKKIYLMNNDTKKKN
jgi:disulfide bond formation protein DsbB